MSAVRSTLESSREEVAAAAAAAAEEEEEVGLLRRVWSEKKKLWVVAGPAIVVRVSTFGITVVTQSFIGRLSSTELAAYAIVSTVILRFASGIIFGMASALETLSGQAFGAKQKHMLGIYLQRSWIILLLTTIFLVPLFIFTSPILRLLGQQMTITTTAATFSLWFIPLAFSFVFTYTFQIFFQSQSKNSIISYLACLSLALHILFSWLVVSKLSFGVSGAIGSSVIVLWFTIIGEFIFLFSDQCRDTWKGFSWDALRDLWPIIKLSFSSGLMIWVRVANELGAGSAKNAKFTIRVAVATSLVIGLLFFALFLVFRGNLAYLFTKSSKVASTVSNLSPLLALSLILNSLQPVLSEYMVRDVDWHRSANISTLFYHLENRLELAGGCIDKYINKNPYLITKLSTWSSLHSCHHI
ncbi:Protein transparent TESTA 12 [Apostasia shenzhenica]|uniref:Protein transparent TESTA 12 n=1 Tax=Apostasia shenzhenica TaxID=1088818 RepID=A0A2I0ASI8_9ASPA|nr:Protein transparent TESTA 12 [Apostasia shenzhenica]